MAGRLWRPGRRVRAVLALVVTLSILMTTAPKVDAAPPAWATVPSPNGVSAVGQIQAVAKVSSTEAWAVGESGTPSVVLIEHYTSGAWTTVVGPAITGAAQLTALAVVSATDVWAVGFSTPSGIIQTLTLHYDGASWSVVSSPNSSVAQINKLQSVAMVSTSDVWAVGAATNGGGLRQTLTEHYTSAAGTATATSATSLTQASATWAVNSQVGRTVTAGASTAVVTTNTATVLTVAAWVGGTPGGTSAYTLIGWAIVSSPNVNTTQNNELLGVSVVTASDVWAVGVATPAAAIQTLGQHYGTASGTAAGTPTATTLTDAAATWAVNSQVGRTVTITATGKSAVVTSNTATVLTFAAWSPVGLPAATPPYTLVGWAILNTPDASAQTNNLQSVAAVSASDVWAVGVNHTVGGFDQPLTEHFTTASGTAAGTPTATTLTDASAAWAVNSQVGRTVTITATGKSAVVTSNTATVLTFAAWSPVGLPAAAPPYTLAGWAIVTSASTGAFLDNRLTSVAVVGASDLWAVGNAVPSATLQTLTEHYTSMGGTATATSATSLTDGAQAWPVNSQVGRTITIAATGKTAVVTSNTATVLTFAAWSPVGTPGATTPYTLSGWAIVTSPSTSPAENNQLIGVAVVSATELWAAGSATLSGNATVMTQHYTSSAGTATATTATSLTDTLQAWAVNSQAGRTITAGSTTGVVTSNTATVLTIAAWSPAATPGATTAYTLAGWAVAVSGAGNPQASHLNSTAMVSSTELWAVGNYTDPLGNTQPLIEHYIAGAWSVSPAPTFASGGSLNAVAVISSTDVWVVGFATVGGHFQTLTMHYDGVSWSTVSSPDTATTLLNLLNSVTVVSASNLWAVGWATNGGAFNQPLTEQYTTAAGTATGTSATTLTEAGRTWAVNSQVGRTITAGVSTAVVTANTATVLTVAAWIGGTPGNVAYTLVGWAIVTSPTPSVSQHSSLTAVADTTNGDLWAVGGANVAGVSQNMTQHYTTSAGTSSATAATSLTDPNGSWGVNSEVGRTITVGGTTGVVTSNTGTVLTIAAWSPVGTPAAVSNYTLAGWAVVSSPSTLVSQTNAMNGVTVVSPTDIWAAGYGSVAGTKQNMTLHYTAVSGIPTSAPTTTTLTDTTQVWPVNSQVGRTVSIPTTGKSAVVTSNTATALTFAAWAPVGLPGAVPYTLSGWAVVSIPDTNTAQINQLNSVTAISASELWAVGDGDVAGVSQTLTEHYTTLSSTATSAPTTTTLTDTTQAWAVNSQAGRTITIPATGKTAVVTSNTATVLTFAAWSPVGLPGAVPYGLSGWAIVASTNLGSSTINNLFGVVAGSGANVWAVGYGTLAASASTLVEQYSGTATASTTTLTSALNPGAYGTAVFLTATVTPASPVPTGSVTFMDGTTTLQTIPLDATGTALFGTSTLSVAGSPHSITAVYSGDAAYAGGTSSVLNQVVNTAPSGTLYSWGENNLGELGTGATTNYSACPTACSDVPQQPAGVGPSIVAAAAGNAAAGLTAAGNVYTWGTNGSGELGTGVASCGANPCMGSATPALVLAGACTACGTNLNNIIQVTSGVYSMMALRSDGTVWAWGLSTEGELGYNSTVNSKVPVQVRDNAGVGLLRGIVQIAEAGSVNYALQYDGTVWSWGHGANGGRGDNSAAIVGYLPVHVRNTTNTGILTNIVSIGAGGTGGYAVTSAGAALAWGRGDVGQLGNGTTGTVNALPVAVSTLGAGTTVRITGSQETAYALLTGGTLKSWGDGSFGQLGNNTSCGATSTPCTGSSTPVAVSTLTSVTSIAGGFSQGYAVTAGGTAYAWGHGNPATGSAGTAFGDLGNSTKNDSSVPVATSVGTAQIVAGGGFAWSHMAIGSSGSLTLSVGGVPGPVRVQHNEAMSGGNVTSLPVSLPQLPAINNLVVVVASGSANVALTGPAGYTLAKGGTSGTSGSIWYKVALGGESQSVTVSCTSGSLAVEIQEWSGMVASSPLDQTASNVAGGSLTTTATGTTAVTTQASELVIAAMGVGGVSAGNTFSPWSAGYTTGPVDLEAVGTTRTGLGVASQVVASPATQTATATWSAAGTPVGLIATFKASGAIQIVAFPPMIIDGTDQTITQTVTFTVADTRGTGAGWAIAGTGTQFGDGNGHTLPATATTVITKPTWACGSGCSAPNLPNGANNTTTYPYALPTGTATTMANAIATTGQNTMSTTVTFSLTIPGSQIGLGTYLSTWTFTIS